MSTEPADIPPDVPVETKLGPLAHLIDRPAVANFDAAGERWADTLRGNPAADRLFYALSTAGDHGIIWHVVGLGRAATGRATLADAIELSAALGVEAALVNGPVKMLFRRVRPVHESERPHRLRQPRTSSFPSGHASAGTFAATVLAPRTRRPWVWYVVGALVGWSRVHVRIHHPSDVVGGAVVGWVLGKAATAVLARNRRR